MREEKGSESSVMRTVIGSDRNRKERSVERSVSYGVREKWRRGFESTGSTMVSKANRYESIETENHRHESRNTQKKPRKFGFQHELRIQHLLHVEVKAEAS